MPEIPKEELDKVFREGADQYDFQFKPEAWDHMETLLDRDRRRRKVFWWWLGVLGLLVLLIGLGSFFLRTDVSIRAEILKHSTEAATAASVSPKTDSQNNSPHTRPIPGISAENEEAAVSSATAQPAATQEQEPVVKNIPKKTFSKNLTESEQAPLPKNIIAIPDQQTTPEYLTGQIQIGDLPETPSTIGNMARQTWFVQPLASDLYYLPVNTLRSEDGLLQPVLIESGELSPRKSKFIFGATFSPELVSVGLDNFSRLGIKAGLLAEYQYFRRLGLSAGLNFLRKSYQAAKGEYHPPYGFWIRKIAPIETDGVCTILELPLMLTYYTRGYDRSGIYGAFGASSYLMLKEKYTYQYDVSDADLIRDWRSKQPTEHWLSMLNFTLGYNGPLSEKLSYRVGLYGQMPLSGVGHGKVNLHSLGINFQLMFQKLEH